MAFVEPLKKGDRGYIYNEQHDGIEAEFVKFQGKTVLVRLLEDTVKHKKGTTVILLQNEFCVDVLPKETK
jgi:hypothetical protein